MKNPKYIQKQEEFDIKYILRQFTKKWYWFLIAIPFFLALAIWQNERAIPQYHVSSKILIEVARDRVIHDEGTSAGLNLLARSKTINNEIAVLHSRDLIKRTVDSLNLNVSFYYENNLTNELFGPTLPFDIRADFSKADRLRGARFLMSMTDENSYRLQVDDEDLGTFGMGQIIRYREFNFIIDKHQSDEVQLDVSEPVVFYIDSQEAIIEKYMTRLEVIESDKDTDAIILALDENVAERGELFLEQMLQSYFYKLLEDRKRAAASTYEFIDNRLQLNFGHLDSLELAIEDFKRNKDIIDPQTESRYILQGIKQFEIELSDAETQYEIVSDLVNKALTNPRMELDLSVPNTTMGVTDPLLNKLVIDLNRKQNKLRIMSKTVRQENPLYQELQAEVEDLRTSVMVDLFNLKDNMETSVRHIRNQITEYRQRLDEMSFDEKGLVAMERVRDNKEELYIYLLKKREEAAMVLASELMDTWVIEKPFSGEMFYNPKRGVVLLIGLFLGLFIPVSIILVWMVFDNKVRRASDFESMISAPIVARVMQDKRSSRKMGQGVISDPSLSEDFKQLALNMRFQFEDLKALMVSSAVRGEGKTFTTYHLALSEAALGKKVCFVELDLRRPIIAGLVGANPDQGLVEHLMGVAELDEVIVKHPKQGGADFIPAGMCPIDPTRILIDSALDALIIQLKKKYDLVIIDTPALDEVSDALHAARLVDATAIVIRQGHTNNDALKPVAELINGEQLCKVCVVFNGLNDEHKASMAEYDPYARASKGRKLLESVFTKRTAQWKA